MRKKARSALGCVVLAVVGLCGVGGLVTSVVERLVRAPASEVQPPPEKAPRAKRPARQVDAPAAPAAPTPAAKPQRAPTPAEVADAATEDSFTAVGPDPAASSDTSSGGGGSSGGGSVYVRSYTRKDGTIVRAHSRRRPGG